jgi:hypothetical protein
MMLDLVGYSKDFGFYPSEKGSFYRLWGIMDLHFNMYTLVTNFQIH